MEAENLLEQQCHQWSQDLAVDIAIPRPIIATAASQMLNEEGAEAGRPSREDRPAQTQKDETAESGGDWVRELEKGKSAEPGGGRLDRSQNDENAKCGGDGLAGSQKDERAEEGKAADAAEVETNQPIEESRIQSPDPSSSSLPRVVSPGADQAALSKEPFLPGLPDDVGLNIIMRVPRCRITAMRQVCRRWRDEVGSENYFEARRRAGLTEAWLYVSVSDWQGCNSWFAFDPSCQRWHPLPRIPGSENRNVLTLQFAVLGGKLLVSGMVERENPVGGARGVFLYDPRTNQWQRASPTLTGRWFCMSGVVDGRLYVAGGIGTCNNLALVQSVEMYDPEVDRWQQVEAGSRVELMTLPGYQATLNGTLYAKNIGWGPRLGVAYEPEKGVLHELSNSMVQGWNGPTAALDGRLYVADFGSEHRLKVWDRQADTWHMVGDIQMLGGSHKAWAVQLAAFQGKLCLLLPDLTVVSVDLRKALAGRGQREWSAVTAEVTVVRGLEDENQIGQLAVSTAAVLGCQVLEA